MAATETTKLHLVKSDLDEAADIEVYNDNMDKIDQAMPIVVFSETEPANPVEGTIWLKPIGG